MDNYTNSQRKTGDFTFMTLARKPRIYLDYNATAPVRQESRARFLEQIVNYGNESSVHSEGRAARAVIEAAREDVAALVGAQASNVIFNSGATEGNNTVLRAFSGREGGILASAIEHPSVLEAAPDIIRIPVTSQGIVDLAALETLCARKTPALISVMLANNETGAIQPLQDVVAIAGRKNIPVHCDAVQAAGRILLDITALGVDFLTLSSHKIGGGTGAGALVLGGCFPPPVLLRGGGQEHGARAGTANIPAITAFGAAAKAAHAALAEEGGEGLRIAALRDRLESGVSALTPEVVFFARDSRRIPNTSLFALPGLSSRTALIHFDLEGIAISNGSACSSGVVKVSHVLRAMGVAEGLAECALRVSLGWDSTEAHVSRFLESWETLVKRVRKSG